MITRPLPNVFPLTPSQSVWLLDQMEKFKAQVMVVKGDNQVSLQSLLSIISLNAKPPKGALLAADGEDEDEAMETALRVLQEL
ncbi:MAG: HPr family phosphocarrier protein [Clostridia bacterium]|nr:HPr family phosphocarrier protein [Clostridia bacterium]